MASRFSRRCIASISKGRLTPVTVTRHFTATTSLAAGPQRTPKSPSKPSSVKEPVTPTKEDYMEGISYEQFTRAAEAEQQRFNLMTPLEYYDTLKNYTAQLAKGTKPRDLPKSEYTADVLHDLGCLVRMMPYTWKARQAILIELWSHAIDLGSQPSLLSLCYYLARGKGWGALSRMGKYELQFKRLVAQGKDPNVLMVEATRLLELGDRLGAIRLLEKARNMDSEDYEWRRLGDVLLSRAYVELQRYDEATAVMLPLAEEGVPEAQLELGKIIKQSGKDIREAREYVFQSLRGGDMSGTSLLAEMAQEDVSNAKDQASKDEHLRWAIEWSRLADHKATG